MKKIIVAIGAVIVLAGGITGAVLVNNNDQKQTGQLTQVQPSKKSEVSYRGVEGKSALDILRSSHTIQTKTYEGLGELVTTIDGVTPNAQHYWAFYVNGKQSEVGAGSYITKSTDTITWKLEAVQ